MRWALRIKKGLKDLGRLIIAIEVFLMILSGALLFAFAPNMVGIFSKDPAVISLGSVVLRMVAISEPFYGVSIIIEGVLQSAGKTMMPFVCSVTIPFGNARNIASMSVFFTVNNIAIVVTRMLAGRLKKWLSSGRLITIGIIISVLHFLQGIYCETGGKEHFHPIF